MDNIDNSDYINDKLKKTELLNKSDNKRDWRIDVLKALSIIFVVLFHCGLSTNGYLAVDTFLVIAGFLMMKSFLKAESRGGFKYFRSLIKNVLRFWPLILLVSFTCLIIGFLTMLPDDFENLGESVVASSAFSENILASITTKNYWNISNNYKPLMHFWYIGVLMQAYIVFPAIFKIANKIHKNALIIVLIILTVGSLLMYLLPVFSSTTKFYWLPFRSFELLLGSCVCFLNGIKIRKIFSYIASALLFCTLCFVFAVRLESVNDTIYLLITVALSSSILFFIYCSECIPIRWVRIISIVGESSFSIYAVHQPVIAFSRYLFCSSITGSVFIVDLLLIATISLLSFVFVEKKLGLFLSNVKYKLSLIPSFCVFMITAILGGIVYAKAGVFHNYPELDVYVSSAHRGMHAEYVDVPYSWNKDFDDNGRINILVIGDSMGRDWANILNESKFSDSYNISYVHVLEVDSKYDKRFEEADYVFYSVLDDSTTVKEYLKKWENESKFYNVGIKNFGESNGQIYQKRYQKNYYELSIKMGYNSYAGIMYGEQNKKQKEYWGEKYIDLIEPIQKDDGTIPVFTDTHKFISHDTEHLTKNGAIYYSKLLDLSWIK